MRSDELIISSIVISSYYGPVDFVESYNPKKTNESHTKHSNYIKRLIEFLFNLIEVFIFFFYLTEKEWKSLPFLFYHQIELNTSKVSSYYSSSTNIQILIPNTP